MFEGNVITTHFLRQTLSQSTLVPFENHGINGVHFPTDSASRNRPDPSVPHSNMIGKLAFLVAIAAIAVLANPTPPQDFPGGDEESIIIVPADLHPTAQPPEPKPENERTLACLYTSCASTLNCTNTNYYCGYDLFCGYRCFPKKCIGFCSSGSQCLTGACTLNLCQSCIG